MREPFFARAVRAEGILPAQCPVCLRVSLSRCTHFLLPPRPNRPAPASPTGVPVVVRKATSKTLLAGSIFAGMPRLDHKLLSHLQACEAAADWRLRLIIYSITCLRQHGLSHRCRRQALLYSRDLRWRGRKPGTAPRLIEGLSRRHVDHLRTEAHKWAPGASAAMSWRNGFWKLSGKSGPRPPGLRRLHVGWLVTVYKTAGWKCCVLACLFSAIFPPTLPM
jgi:hypothetical protein